MKEKYLINARIIDPNNQMDEIGGLSLMLMAKFKLLEKMLQMEICLLKQKK